MFYFDFNFNFLLFFRLLMFLFLCYSIALICVFSIFLVRFLCTCCSLAVRLLPVQYCLQDLNHISKVPKSTLPLICFRDGSLPVLDFLDNFSSSLVLGAVPMDP